MADDPTAADRNVEIWMIKKLIKSLEAARGRPNRFGSVDRALACGLKGPRFDSGPGHVPWLRAHPELGALTALLSDDSKFGFIVIDGSGALFGTLQGNTREVLHKFTVDLPKKHGRGGQSALRFARLRMEKRHNYVRKVAETAVQLFISGDKVNVAGLVLAGSADFKTELSQSDMFDQRLQSKVLKLVDISYGGENGFNQAIELSTEVLSNVKFIQEKKLIGRYFDEISQDTGKYCFGVEDTLKALEMGAVEILIVYENLDIMRYVLHCQGTEEEKILYLTPEQEKDKSHFTDKEVCILRYRVDFQGMEYQGGDDEFFDLDDY
ncbi:Eukaryotic peptide chain release factor subunit 1 [Myotis davidii]|uniref:Eukaryotic peptide chain release factor subunit 1 n=1 Tax=Myotis davidii TaxID=225400 RepID=L5LDK3_MYODS|nr:Eukaryotic peptide chain release factor subunit 1 [Myotis davidii]